MFEVKVEGQKENCRLGPTRHRCAQGWLNWKIFHQPPTLSFNILVDFSILCDDIGVYCQMMTIMSSVIITVLILISYVKW